MKKVFVCGNSFSHGHYLIKDNISGPINYNTVKVGQNKPYISFIKDELDIDYVLLAKPIASNYCICKQIEYAIEYKPDLVIVNFSTARHIDFTVEGNRLSCLPTLKNFIYDEKTFAPGMKNPTGSDDIDQAIKSLRYTILKEYASTTNPEYILINQFIYGFTDYYLKIDQERLMILGAINLLRKHNIKFIVVDLIETEKQPDLSNPVALADTNVLNGLKVEPLVKIPAGFREKYPNPTDDFHFNEEGQREVAKLLTPLVKELLSFNQ
jgi:hypothetical protein